MPDSETECVVKRTRYVPFLDKDTYRITFRRGQHRGPKSLCDFLCARAIRAEMDTTSRIVPVIQLHGVPDLNQVEAIVLEWAQARSRSS
jgi:hypothetical protein